MNQTSPAPGATPPPAPTTDTAPPDGFPPNRILAYAAGVVFLLLLLGIAFVKPDLETNYLVRVILAVAAGAFAAVIPGFLHINLDNRITAGGALAVVLLVFWGAPKVQPKGVNYSFTIPPSTSLRAAADLLASSEELVVLYALDCTPALLAQKLKGGTVSGKTVAIAMENLIALKTDPAAPPPTMKAVIDQPGGRVRVSCE